jgi:hypothetical protein
LWSLAASFRSLRPSRDTFFHTCLFEMPSSSSAQIRAICGLRSCTWTLISRMPWPLLNSSKHPQNWVQALPASSICLAPATQFPLPTTNHQPRYSPTIRPIVNSPLKGECLSLKISI